MSELTEHLRHIGCLNKPRCIEAADLLDAQATELARLRKQEPVAYVSIIDDDKPRSDIIDRELPPLTPLYAAPIPPVTIAKLEAEVKATHTIYEQARQHTIENVELKQEVTRLTTHIRAIAEHHDQYSHTTLDWKVVPAWTNYHTARRDFALKVFDV